MDEGRRVLEALAAHGLRQGPGVLEMLRQAVAGAKRNGRPVGICGEAPATYPEVAALLARAGIDSISVNPGSFPRTVEAVPRAEAAAELS